VEFGGELADMILEESGKCARAEATALDAFKTLLS
jgi:hypothetical protein